jgi:hypothetical protein
MKTINSEIYTYGIARGSIKDHIVKRVSVFPRITQFGWETVNEEVVRS